jgi:hypothetical protein
MEGGGGGSQVFLEVCVGGDIGGVQVDRTIICMKLGETCVKQQGETTTHPKQT